MIKEYYKIKDNCRAGLLKYLAEAVSMLPKINNPKILDIGCGTGVPTLWLAENFGGIITAIDTDKHALEWLQMKSAGKKLENYVNPLNISFFDLNTESDYFDIILAEGFLNIIGFKQGFAKVIRMIKKGGYFLIHDEYKDHKMKCNFIRKNSCELVGTVYLSETVWWNGYYRQLEEEIDSIDSKLFKDLFKSELNELKYYRKDPSPFKSIYYIVKKF